jgi:hypothetical protein
VSVFHTALAYPVRGERRGRRIAGSLVLVVSLALLITVPVYAGYLVRLLRNAAYGDEAPPGLHDVGGLFVEGLSAVGLVVAYAALPMAPFVVASLPPVDVAFGRAGAVAFAAAVVALGYVLPAVLTAYAVAGSVVGGLSVRRIGRVLGSRSYLTAWVPAAAVVGPALVGTWALGWVGVAAIVLVGAPLVLYATVTGCYLVARGFAGAVDLPRRPVARRR